jgi:thiamine biosynthesis lipoprotein
MLLAAEVLVARAGQRAGDRRAILADAVGQALPGRCAAAVSAPAGVTVAEAPASTAAGPRRGPHRVERVMGTVVTFDVRDPDVDEVALDRAIELLHDVDARFSTFLDDSEISRLDRGDLRVDGCSPDVRHVLALCDDLRRTSGGYFDARRHRSDGGLDPSGLVKGWSIEEASLVLEAAGARNYAINAGGDVVAMGSPEPGRPWRVGIRHPRLADRLAATLSVNDRSVATSGAYERGDHIRDPHTGLPPRGLLSMTVVGSSLTWADAYATAAFCMGGDGLAWVAGHPGYGACAITADERVIWTPLLDDLLVS